jgi:hypothetical protein
LAKPEVPLAKPEVPLAKPEVPLAIKQTIIVLFMDVVPNRNISRVWLFSEVRQKLINV